MMKRITGRLATNMSAGVVVGLSAASGAWASDIVCKSPARETTVRCENPDGSGLRCSLATEEARTPARRRHLICDSARLTERYDRIYAEQQRMLSKGRIQSSDIAAWRARRDACDSVRCLESMFARFWRERDAMRSPQQVRPAPPPSVTTAMPPPANHEPAPPPEPVSTQSSEQTAAPMQAPPETPPETPPSAEPVAMQARPEPVAPDQPPAPLLETLPDRQSTGLPIADDMHNSPGKSYSASLSVESLLAGLAALGAGFLWGHRTVRAQDRPRSAIPAAMVIVYGLLLVNVLLLLFTLGLK